MAGKRSNHIYAELAPYYDMVYEWKDYSAEADFIKNLISQRKLSDGNELLDVGCGTGKHIRMMTDSFRCTGLDLSREMLKVARKNVRDATFVQGNMIDFSLKSRFDVILCLFSAIAYTRTDENLKKALKNFARHLKPGGIVVIQPWITKSRWKKGHMHLETFDSDDVKIARVSYSNGDARVSKLRMEYLVAERGKGIRHFVEEDELPYFDRRKYERLMKEEGLSAEFIAHSLFRNRGLLVGVKG